MITTHFSLPSSLKLTDGGEGGEAVVKTVEKSPALVIREDKGSCCPDNEGEEENHHDQVNLQRSRENT